MRLNIQVKLLTPTEVLDGLLFRMIYHIFYCVKNSFELPGTIIYTNIWQLVFDPDYYFSGQK